MNSGVTQFLLKVAMNAMMITDIKDKKAASLLEDSGDSELSIFLMNLIILLLLSYLVI
jgi:hypothetical protein